MNFLDSEDRNIILSVIESTISAFDSDIIEEVAKYGVDPYVDQKILDILIDMRRMDLYHDAIKKFREHCENANRI